MPYLSGRLNCNFLDVVSCVADCLLNRPSRLLTIGVYRELFALMNASQAKRMSYIDYSAYLQKQLYLFKGSIDFHEICLYAGKVHFVHFHLSKISVAELDSSFCYWFLYRFLFFLTGISTKCVTVDANFVCQMNGSKIWAFK